MRRFKITTRPIKQPTITPLQRAIRHYDLISDAGGTPDDLAHMMIRVHQASRAEFQERHGFQEWDDTWETLWTVETGYRLGA
jgi:hypothetical protein